MSIDVLRGFALLGILAVNITFFALPGTLLFNPSAECGFEGINLLEWKVVYLFFSQKFMTIFSMLFGAGLVLMVGRARKKGRSFRGVYYRRVLWLIVFGLCHAYLIWEGDILFFYGCCGLWLYPMRKLAARWLIALGAVVLLIGMLSMLGLGAGLGYIQGQAEAAQAALDAGKELTTSQQETLQDWKETKEGFDPPPEKLQETTETYRGGYVGILAARALPTLQMHTFGFIFFIGWRVLGLMMIGMGLMKTGLFAAERSMRFYTTLAAVGYIVGLPITYLGMTKLLAHTFQPVYAFTVGMQFDYFSSVLVSLAHISVIMIICKSGVLEALRKGLAAVGRTALSNYLLHSIVLTTIFYGYGFGLFGDFTRIQLAGFVVAMWAVNIALSVWWTSRFRFGPAEWLWRSLTYGKLPPMRRAEG